MAIFKGAGVAIATPMNADQSVNYDAFADLIDFQIDNGTDAIIVCGTTGESATMTEEEHVKVSKFCIEHVKGRVPVVAGAGSNWTQTAVDLSKDIAAAGADGLLSVTPYYNKCTQSGLVQHYCKISEAVPNTPIIMYNVPSRTGVNILPETAAKVVKEAVNVVGIKEASGDIGQIVKLMAVTDGNIDLYSGNDDQVVPLLAMGGIGVISVLSNVAPGQVHDMCYKFFEGDVKGAAKMQAEASELVDALFCEVNPIPVKKALELIGIPAGPLRLPLTEISEAHAAQLAQAMKNYGLI